MNYCFKCDQASDLTGSGGCGREIQGASLDEVVVAIITHFHIDHAFTQIEAYSPEGSRQFQKMVVQVVRELAGDEPNERS